MKQTSLLDSFIKKAKSAQNNQNNQKLSQEQSKDSTIRNQLIEDSQKIKKKQNNKSLNNFNQSQSGEIQSIKHKISNILIQESGKMEIQTQKQKSENKKTRSQKSQKKKMTFDSSQNQIQDVQDEQYEQKNQKMSEDELQQSFEKQQSDVQLKKRKNKKIPKFKTKTAQKTKKQQIVQQKRIYEETNPFSRDQFTDKTPQWAIPGHSSCKDSNGKTNKEVGYDQTSLLIPEHQWSKFSAPMKQYWRIKSENFDKIILFKLGKFYELFYEDALIANKYLDLKWMGTKMHNGFPQKSLQRYANQFLKLGFKVVVVEQMETPQQMQERIKMDRKSQKTLNRQITQILTKGTSVPIQTQNSYLPNYLISVYKYNSFIAYSLLDVSTNIILLGIVDNFQDFKTILYQTRPAQLLYDPDNLPFEYVEVMKQNWLSMIITKLINKKNLWHHLNSTNQIGNLIQKKTLKKPEIFKIMDNFDTVPKNLMMSTLSGLFCYLTNLLKFEYVMSAVTFMFYQKQKSQTNMILDSQALQHLQIFQTCLGQTGSLFSKIDKTQSKFGKRMFRRWVTSPLLGTYHINQRLDAIEDLKQHRQQRREILNIISKLPDLQKMVNRLYHYAVTKTNASEAVYFSDLNTTRLKQFKDLFSHLQSSWSIFSILNGVKNNLKSIRLRRLITVAMQQIKCQKQIYFEDEQNDLQQNGLLPNILSQLKQFDQLVLWKDGKPYPKPGLVSSYDNLVQQQRFIHNQLNDYLQSIRKMFKQPDINFAHIKQRYELQIPQKKKIKLPNSFSFTSKKKDYSRYITPQSQQLVEKLQKVEKQIKEQMGLFVSFFFQQFKKKQRIWERYINILAQIDCLTGLSVYASHTLSCRPQFVDKGYEVKDAIHPSLNKVDFIPNDLSFENQIIILTGPNMGGKSTILRTTCLLAILAQIGSYVPAKSYKSSIIDRIFTRIGASDKLQQGKSTFFIQMEQTKSILNHATLNSLAIIDELGRGTSTFDGMALAHSVLNYLITVSKCKCIFATHYHSLTNQFSKQRNVALKMMDYRILNQEEQKILFLYKLINGRAEKSFGLNVAQIVGIDKKAIQIAKVKSQQMHTAIQYKKTLIKVREILNQIILKQK